MTAITRLGHGCGPKTTVYDKFERNLVTALQNFMDLDLFISFDAIVTHRFQVYNRRIVNGVISYYNYHAAGFFDWAFVTHDVDLNEIYLRKQQWRVTMVLKMRRLPDNFCVQ